MYEFIRGHLYLEFALNIIIKHTFLNSDELSGIESTFYQKVKLLKSKGKINNALKSLLLEVNKIRNKLAHNISFELNFEIVYNLVKLAHIANIDFSDDSIHMDFRYSKENYGIEGVIIELMANTFCELLCLNEDIIGTDTILKHMT